MKTKPNTISERDYKWKIEPSAQWTIFSPEGDRIGQIDAVYEQSYVSGSSRSTTYKIDSYEVSVRGFDGDAIFAVVEHGDSARKALAAAKRFARDLHGRDQ